MQEEAVVINYIDACVIFKNKFTISHIKEKYKKLAAIIDNSVYYGRTWFMIFLTSVSVFVLLWIFTAMRLRRLCEYLVNVFDEGWIKGGSSDEGRYSKLDTCSSFTTLRRQHSQLFRAFLTVARRPLNNVQRRCLESFKLAQPLTLVSCSVLSLEYLVERLCLKFSKTRICFSINADFLVKTAEQSWIYSRMEMSYAYHLNFKTQII